MGAGCRHSIANKIMAGVRARKLARLTNDL